MLLDRFDPFLAEFDRLTQRALGPDAAGMPMDVTRRGEELVLRVDLPGVAPENISLTVENHTLTIAAERHSSYADDEQVLLQERFDGTMTRRLRVPDWVDAERVTAEHVHGVLIVRMPLAEQARPRRIEVHAAPEQTQIAS
jgi:HSP20 family protein